MYYEGKIVDGWLWHRSTPGAQFERATAEQTIAYLLEKLTEAEVALQQCLSG